MQVLSRMYNAQHNRSYLTVIPTNVFGPFDNYSIEVQGPLMLSRLSRLE